jgi:hypothetical protein
MAVVTRPVGAKTTRTLALALSTPEVRHTVEVATAPLSAAKAADRSNGANSGSGAAGVDYGATAAGASSRDDSDAGERAASLRVDSETERDWEPAPRAVEGTAATTCTSSSSTNTGGDWVAGC